MGTAHSTLVIVFIVQYGLLHTVGIEEKCPQLFSAHRLDSVQRSRKRCSPFSSHPAGWPAIQPFSEQKASDMIGYSLSNDWNAVSGMPAIGKI